MNCYKTIEASRLYNNFSFSSQIEIKPNIKVESINKLIAAECTYDDLYEYITTEFLLEDKNFFFIKYDEYDNLYEYIINKSYTDLFDLLTIDYSYKVESVICKITDNVELYIKYSSDYSIEHIFLSLLYNYEETALTLYILDNYKKNTNIVTVPYYYIDIIDSDIRFRLIKYVITKCNLSYNNICIYDQIFNSMSDDKRLDITRTLLENYLDDKCIIFKEFMSNIMHKFSFEIFKYFMEEYFSNIHENILINFIKKVSNLSILQYLFEMIDRTKLCPEFFTNYYTYEIIKWLHNVQLLNYSDRLLCDIDCILFIIKIATDNHDYIFIKNNTRLIMQKIINCNMFDQLLSIVPINFYDLNIIFEIAAMSEHLEIIDMIVKENYKPACINNVLHDLKLLNKDKIIDYINTYY